MRLRFANRIVWYLIFAITCLIGADSTIALAQNAVRPFTVKDDIELTYFGEVRFSPNSNYLAVYTERGRLELDRCESSLRFYRSEEVEDFLKKSDGAKLPV